MALSIPNFYLLNLTMEVLHCDDTSVTIYQSTRLGITEDLNLHASFYKKLNSLIFRGVLTM
jgi:hypothetical protein